jgi:hypothetical protein
MLKHVSGKDFRSNFCPHYLCPHYLLAPVIAIVAVVLLWPGQALAQETLIADCSTDNLQDVIEDLDDRSANNRLVISGTCTNSFFLRKVDCDPGEIPGPNPLPGDCREVEFYTSFTVEDFTGSLRIEADPVGGAIIGQRRNLDFPPFPADPPPDPPPGPVQVDCNTAIPILFSGVPALS